MIGLGDMDPQTAATWLFGNPFSPQSIAAYTDPASEAAGLASAQAIFNQIMNSPSPTSINKNYLMYGILGIFVIALLFKSKS